MDRVASVVHHLSPPATQSTKLQNCSQTHQILSGGQIQHFKENGFLVLDSLVDSEFIEELRSRVGPLFSGKFETGIYPDEWHWREGISYPDKTKEICNAWKCDKKIASLVLSSKVSQICSELGGWEGARIAQDDVLIKPPGGSEVGYHQDGAYISCQFTPTKDNSVTCWIPLDDVSEETGTLQYIPGSHRWKGKGVQGFHSPNDYKAGLKSAAESAGIKEIPEPVYVTIPKGGAAFHHQRMWHGSGRNTSTTIPRRAIGIHILRHDAKFRSGRITYIYGRYKKIGDSSLDESFFPITYTKRGCRSKHLQAYCDDILNKHN